MWGCTKKAVIPCNINGEELYRCPNRPLLDDPVYYNELFLVFGWYKKGFFPDDGTYLDQPNKLVECFSIIDYTHKQIEKHLEEKNKKKSP